MIELLHKFLETEISHHVEYDGPIRFIYSRKY